MSAPEMPPAHQEAAALLQRIVRNNPFIQQGPAHSDPQKPTHSEFLDEATITIATDYKKTATTPGETLVISISDLHADTRPKELGTFVTKFLAETPEFQQRIDFQATTPAAGKGHVEIVKDRNEPGQMHVLLHLPENYSVAQAVEAIAGLDHHTKEKAASTLVGAGVGHIGTQFAQVDHVELVGAHPNTPEAQKICQDILAKFQTTTLNTNQTPQNDAPQVKDLAGKLTPFAEELILSVETAHNAIQNALKAAAQPQQSTKDALPMPSPQVMVQQLSPCQGAGLAA